MPGYLAVQGSDLAARSNRSSVHGAFTFGRPSDALEQRLLLALRLRRHRRRAALWRSFRANCRRHCATDSIGRSSAGRVDEADLVYHGHLRTIEGLPMRQVELRVDDARRRRAVPSGLAGRHRRCRSDRIHRARHAQARSTQAISPASACAAPSVFLPPSVEYVDYRGPGRATATALRQLIDTSPLVEMADVRQARVDVCRSVRVYAALEIPMASGIVPKADLKLDLKDSRRHSPT